MYFFDCVYYYLLYMFKIVNPLALLYAWQIDVSQLNDCRKVFVRRFAATNGQKALKWIKNEIGLNQGTFTEGEFSVQLTSLY